MDQQNQNKSAWEEVHRIKNDRGQAVSIQRLTLQNGRKKYSMRMGYERDNGEMSSFVEFRVKRDEENNVREDTIGSLVSLLNASGEWLMEQTKKDDAEWRDSRPVHRPPPKRDGENRGTPRGTMPPRTGKTARDREKKSRKPIGGWES